MTLKFQIMRISMGTEHELKNLKYSHIEAKVFKIFSSIIDRQDRSLQ